MGEKGEVYRLLVGKPERKGSLGWPTLRWVNNIKMDLGKIDREVCSGMWRALMNMVMNLLVP
jgi:hypothetical protein